MEDETGIALVMPGAVNGQPNGASPWEYLDKVRAMDLKDRPQHLDPWIALVAKQPHAERDALIALGKDVWKYRMDTARDTLRQMDEVTRGLSRSNVCLATDDFVAETVYRAGHEHEVGYLVHYFDHPEDPPKWVESLESGKAVYYPPNSRLMELGVVLFPSGTEEYGSDYDLFIRLRHFFLTYVQLDNTTFRTLICCYVLMTWLFDRFEAIPYLRAQGDFGTGKTRLIQAVGSICYRTTMAGGATTEAPVFRVIDRYHGTLVIDEADFTRGSELWEGMTKILNCGYQRGFPVLRAERSGGQDSGFEPMAYDVFGPKILATRRAFQDAALESRCLSYTMPLLTEINEKMPLVLGPEFRADAQRLRNMLLLWRFRHYQGVVVDPRARVAGAEPRVNQIIQPILACVDDVRIRDEVLRTVKEYTRTVQNERLNSLEGITMAATFRTWIRKGKAARILTKDVTAELRERFDMPNITERKVSDVLKRSLRVEMRSLGGMSWAYVTEEKARELCGRFGVALEDYMGGIPSA